MHISISSSSARLSAGTRREKMVFTKRNRHFHKTSLAASGSSMWVLSCAICSSWVEMTHLENGSKAVPGSSEANSSTKVRICCHGIHTAFLGQRNSCPKLINTNTFIPGWRWGITHVLCWGGAEEDHGSVSEVIMIADTAFPLPGVPQLLSAPWQE